MRLATRPTKSRDAQRRVVVASAFGLVSLVLVALVLLACAAGAAATRAGDVRIVAPDGSHLDHGGSATPFAYLLPVGARCPGDTAHAGYRIDSYLVPKGVVPSAVSFRGGVPSRWFGLIAQGAYVGAINTERNTGRIVNLPQPAVWSRLTPHDLFRANESSSTWDGGIACATAEGAVVRTWGFDVTFTRDSHDRGGFTWRVPTTATSSSQSRAGVAALVLAAGALAVVAIVAISRRRGPRVTAGVRR